MLRHPGNAEAVVLLRGLSTAAWSFDPSRSYARAIQTRSLKRVWKRLGDFPPLREALWGGFAELRDRAPELAAAATRNPEVLTALRTFLRSVEHAIPAPPELVAAIRQIRPDIVLILSRCSHGGVEPDLVKAARACGIPSAMLVWSWDNLSSKSAIDEHPDRLIVWNAVMAEEATRLHGIDANRVRITGAVNFDPFFAKVAAHAPVERREILYLGSSTNVVPDELPVFRRWLASVRTTPELAEVPVAVRPHPSTPIARCADWERDLVVDGQARFSFARGSSLAHDLASARAAVAINTSAEIEAAIADVPVLTFRAGDEAPGQEGSVHYSYLLEGSGGFVREAATLGEHVAQLRETMRTGGDGAGRRGFVESFVRPLGIDRPVAPVVADAVLELIGR